MWTCWCILEIQVLTPVSQNQPPDKIQTTREGEKHSQQDAAQGTLLLLGVWEVSCMAPLQVNLVPLLSFSTSLAEAGWLWPQLLASTPLWLPPALAVPEAGPAVACQLMPPALTGPSQSKDKTLMFLSLPFHSSIRFSWSLIIIIFKWPLNWLWAHCYYTDVAFFHCLSWPYFSGSHSLFFTPKAIPQCYYLKYSKTWCLSCSQHMTSKRKRGKKAEGFRLESQRNTAKNSVFYMHLIPLEQPLSLVMLPLIAQITCIWQPQRVPTEETLGHPTATLWDRWPPCDTPIRSLWLEAKVLKIGEPQGQGCGCWVASQSPRQQAYSPGIRWKEKEVECLLSPLTWDLLGWESDIAYGNWCPLTLLILPQAKCPGRSCYVQGRAKTRSLIDIKNKKKTKDEIEMTK